MNDNEKRLGRDRAQRPRRLVETPVGMVMIEESPRGIASLRFVDDSEGLAPTSDTGLYLADAEAQLSEYFAGTRRAFDLPLDPLGSDFQRRVWAALRDIPYGETRSYRDVAAAIGNPNAARAVGRANNRNPILILIPCHRVVGKDGQLAGYAGGIERKQFLLDLEASRRP